MRSCRSIRANLHRPVVGVSWDDAKAFCEWLTKRERGSEALPEGMHTMWRNYHRGVTEPEAEKFWSIRLPEPGTQTIVEFRRSA